MGARSDTGAPRPFRVFRPGGAAPRRLTVGRRARASRARDADVVGRQPAHSGRADESSGRRIDRGARGRGRGIRRRGDPREPRPGATACADDADLDPARAAHDRVRRRFRGVGGSERGAGARRRGQRRRGAGVGAGTRTPPGHAVPDERLPERTAPGAARARGGGEGGGGARGPGPLHASQRRSDGPRARRTARDAEARTRGGTRAVDAGDRAGRDASAARRLSLGGGPALDTAAGGGLISRMRNRLLAALAVPLLALTTRAGAAQTTLQLRWELVGDSLAGDWGVSRVSFTLTNRGSKPLPSTGWAIYFNALHSAVAGSVASGFNIEDVIADLHRLAPAAGFAGLAPGASVRIPYLTDLLLNVSFVPKGPYIVFDDAKDVGARLNDYVAVPFERAPQDAGRHPRVVSAEKQFALDSAIRITPASELPPVFPTPLEVTREAGTLQLTALPPVEAPEALKNEAAFVAEYLRPYFGATRRPTGPPLRLEVGPVAGETSAEAYTLVVAPAQGVRVVGVSPAGVFYGLQSLRSLLPAPTPRTGLVLPAIRVVDAPRFGYRGFMLDVARNFHPKAAVLRTLDLIARYKLNVFHIHLTDDEGWRIEIPSLPELTAVGGRRGHPPDSDRHLPPAFGSGPLVDRPWGSGFFSHADYVEIVRYAAARHIEVIPEIEMPGHARAAMKAMQANQQYRLNDPEDRSVYTTVQGYP